MGRGSAAAKETNASLTLSSTTIRVFVPQFPRQQNKDRVYVPRPARLIAKVRPRSGLRALAAAGCRVTSPAVGLPNSVPCVVKPDPVFFDEIRRPRLRPQVL